MGGTNLKPCFQRHNDTTNPTASNDQIMKGTIVDFKMACLIKVGSLKGFFVVALSNT